MDVKKFDYKSKKEREALAAMLEFYHKHNNPF